MLLLARCRSARAGGSSAPRAVVLVRGLVKGLTLSTQLQYPNPPTQWDSNHYRTTTPTAGNTATHRLSHLTHWDSELGLRPALGAVS